MAASEPPQSRTLTELAEAAAATGDFVSAARHLRSLAAEQESQLGSAHPDLANTLNNLAVVAERTGDLEIAESAFRRASVITRARYGATHPSVTTTTQNLRDFCEAHGLPYDEPGAASADTNVERSASPAARARSWSSLVGVGLVGGVAAAVLVVWSLTNRHENPATTAPLVEASTTALADPVPPASSLGSAAPAVVSPPVTLMPPPRVSTPAPAGGFATVNVVTSTVCRDFSTAEGAEWRCTPVIDATGAGPLVFYTRIKTSEPATIEHRWYHGDTLVQRVGLGVSANTGAGYRTFSRHSVSPGRSGPWRVELRAPDGAVLSTQSFVVQ
jgi:hypothetical protein